MNFEEIEKIIKIVQKSTELIEKNETNENLIQSQNFHWMKERWKIIKNHWQSMI